MSDATIGVQQAAAPDRLLDADNLTVSAQSVYRERNRVAGGAAAELADVKNASPADGAYGLVTRPVETPATPQTAQTASGQTVAATTGLTLQGYSIKETSGTGNAVVAIHHGTGTGDPVVVDITLNANESEREWLGPNGIAMASGIYFELVSGAARFVGWTAVK